MSASLEKGLAAFREVIDAPMASYFSSCVHCGLCAEACLFYTETGDPKYAPIHKLEPLRRFWRQENTLLGKVGSALGLLHPITDDELAAWSELVYDSCTLCGRCSMVCPVGNDLTGMIRAIREGMAVAGHAPDGLVTATKRAVNEGSPMGITVDTLRATVKHQEEACGLPIPVDAEGAEYLLLLSSMEIAQFPEFLGSVAKIFHAAGVSWTLSTQAYEATNSGIQIGVSDLAAHIVRRVVTAAEALKVQTVITPECGHGFVALRWEGPELLGGPLPFRVRNILEVLERLRGEGKLRVRDQETTPLTFHDPCQIVRRGGVVEEPRRLLKMVASDFRDMREHGVMNWCCGGGGGVSANERAEPLRARAFARKLCQVEELGVDTLVTSCANCRLIIEEGLEFYHMDVKVVGLTELIAEHLVEPDNNS